MLASYHCHTAFSDGKADPARLVEVADALGLQELGISDHYALMPNGTRPGWSIDPDGLDLYVAAIREQQMRTDLGVIVRLGLEVDWFPDAGMADALRTQLDPHPWDYLIGSVHFVGDFCVDAHPAHWERLSVDECNEIHRRYWEIMATLPAAGLFDIVAHIDLSKKFGYLPTTEPTREIDAALDAIADADLVVEINTAGWHKAVADAYPTEDILRQCCERDIDVTISSDAHRPEHLLRDFRAAAARLAAAGYDEVARFHNRERRYDTLDAAVAGLDDASESPTGLDDF